MAHTLRIIQTHYITMKKEHKKRYPDNWEFISAYIRHERAKNKCESCGLQNGLIIKRLPNNKYRVANENEIRDLQEFKGISKLTVLQILKKMKLTKVILSVAHLDFNESNNNHSNLKALCQKCHNAHDRSNNLLRQKTFRIMQKKNIQPGFFD